MWSGSEITELKESLLDLLFPPICLFCRRDPWADRNFFLCPSCLESIRWIDPPFCHACGLPLPAAGLEQAHYCGRCMAGPPPFSRARYAVLYDGAVRDALLRFKFAGDLRLGRTLARIVISAFHEHFQPDEHDLIVAVPVHRKRLLGRGFNQSLILAAALSRYSGIPLDRTALRKVKDTTPQVMLPRNQRIDNLRGSFAVARPDAIRGRRVLLIDDVRTTGSTLSEASRTLIKKGHAARVDVLTLALRDQYLGRDSTEPEDSASA